MAIPTAHIGVKEQGIIAETVLLPGDPLRAKFIAETYLENPVQFNTVRNMFGYTGTYKGKKISVMGTGMGIPSIGIYSYELIHFYGVKNLIRVGSCGSYQKDVKLIRHYYRAIRIYKLKLLSQFNLPGIWAPTASWELLKKASTLLKKRLFKYHVGNILSSDIFYGDTPEVWENGRRWVF